DSPGARSCSGHSLAQIAFCRYCPIKEYPADLLRAGAPVVETEALQDTAFTALLERIDMHGQLLADFHKLAVPAFPCEHAGGRQLDEPLISRALWTDDFQRDPAVGIAPLELLHRALERDALHDVEESKGMMRNSGRDKDKHKADAEYRSQKSFAHTEAPGLGIRREFYACCGRNGTGNKHGLAGSNDCCDSIRAALAPTGEILEHQPEQMSAGAAAHVMAMRA